MKKSTSFLLSLPLIFSLITSCENDETTDSSTEIINQEELIAADPDVIELISKTEQDSDLFVEALLKHNIDAEKLQEIYAQDEAPLLSEIFDTETVDKLLKNFEEVMVLQNKVLAKYPSLDNDTSNSTETNLSIEDFSNLLSSSNTRSSKTNCQAIQYAGCRANAAVKKNQCQDAAYSRSSLARCTTVYNSDLQKCRNQHGC